MEIINYAKEIGATTYPGRGILLGKSSDIHMRSPYIQ